MKILKERKIDHIVYAVPNLEIAMDKLEEQMGVRPVFGGYHTNKGTKNALLHLGNECYLEILAIDERNTTISTPRWMGIDLISKPKITRWSLKSSTLEKDRIPLKHYQEDMGNIEEGQRKTAEGKLLHWQMTMPLAKPEVEIIPFLTDWQHSSIHPTTPLSQHCKLETLQFTHPHPHQVLPILNQLGLDATVEEGKEVAIFARIQTPNGIVQL